MLTASTGAGRIIACPADWPLPYQVGKPPDLLEAPSDYTEVALMPKE